MKIQSQILNVKPEPQPNSELKADVPTSSPAIGNTPVVGSTDDFRKQKNRDAQEKWRQKRENKDKRNARLKENRLKSPEKIREYERQYRLKNAEKMKSLAKARKIKNPEKLKERKKKDKANQRKNITTEYVKILLRNKLGIPYSEVNKYPKLIELHKQIIKIKRYANENKN